MKPCCLKTFLFQIYISNRNPIFCAFFTFVFVFNINPASLMNRTENIFTNRVLISLTELFNQFFVVLAACFLVNFGKVIFQRAFDNIQFFCNLAAAFSFYQFFENCLLLACQAVKNTFICKKRGYKSLLYVSVAGKNSSFIIRKL